MMYVGHKHLLRAMDVGLQWNLHLPWRVFDSQAQPVSDLNSAKILSKFLVPCTLFHLSSDPWFCNCVCPLVDNQRHLLGVNQR